MVCFSDSSPLLNVIQKTTQSQSGTLSLKKWGLTKGDSVFDAAQTHSARKNYVHKRIKYLSHIIFVHSANRTFSIIIHRRVVRVGIQFCDQFLLLKNHTSNFTLSIWFIIFVHSFDVQISYTKSRFQLVDEDSQFRTQFSTQIRDFNLSTRIVKFTSF